MHNKAETMYELLKIELIFSRISSQTILEAC